MGLIGLLLSSNGYFIMFFLPLLPVYIDYNSGSGLYCLPVWYSMKLGLFFICGGSLVPR
jgi:hypothetical protein